MDLDERIDVGSEEPRATIDQYLVYDDKIGDWTTVGVRDDSLQSFFVDPTYANLDEEKIQPIEPSEDDANKPATWYDSIRLLTRGNDDLDWGNRFLTVEEDPVRLNKHFAVKTYRDGNLETLIEPAYDRDDPDVELSFQRAYKEPNPVYILGEIGGKILVEDNGDTLERMDMYHYSDIEQLDDGSMVGITENGDRSLVYAGMKYRNNAY